MSKNKQVLAIVKVGSARIALFWFVRGWQILSLQFAAWASFSLLSLAVLLLVLTVLGLLLEGLKLDGAWASLLSGACFGFFINGLQGSLLREMIQREQSLVQRPKMVNFSDLLWFLKEKTERWAVLQFSIFMALISVIYALLEQKYFAITSFDLMLLGQANTEEQLPENMGMILLCRGVFWLIMMGLSWAVVPLIADKKMRFKEAVICSVYASSVNVLPLLSLLGILLLAAVGFLLLIGVVGLVANVLALALLFVGIIWGLPLMHLAIFSAYRYIFLEKHE